MDEVTLDGTTLTLAAVATVAGAGAVRLRLDAAARARILAARRVVEKAVEAGQRIYGVTTGFGRLADVVISTDQQATLQRNLVRSHAAGVGEPLAREEVRALMLLRANALARGNSGCREDAVDLLLRMLERGVHPVVPEAGSVGASGDLGPLAHVALALMGEGSVDLDGERMAAADGLAAAGLVPLRLEAKEGLALINGTQATTGVGLLALLRTEAALEAAECAGAMSLEALEGTPEAFRPEVGGVRPHPGQVRSAERLLRLLRDSEIRESHRVGDPRIQDAYSLRCMPQVHGAARQGLAYVRSVLEVEVNSATDNPLILPDTGEVVSAGNFHAQIVAQALDLLCIAAADVAAISERRVERLLNPDLSQGLPAFLAGSPGLESGFMIAQVTAADLLAEMRVLAHPASVDTVPTSANREDHVSMGMAAARKARRVARCLEHVISVELLCAAQGLEHRRPLKAGVGVERAHAALRRRVPPLEGDRPLIGDLEAVRALLLKGAFGPDATDARLDGEIDGVLTGPGRTT
ncbi:MAG: histidine ammonia-lyase [Gemmatimonadetes bacterium]|nr:histidine ammonia-lyase [Gemmatimonadota bacterium]